MEQKTFVTIAIAGAIGWALGIIAPLAVVAGIIKAIDTLATILRNAL